MTNYPKELTDLLQVYMADGVISDAEMQVLLNKAMSLNVNPYEFKLYAEAQLKQFYQDKEDAKKQQMGRLCPHCGKSVPMFADKCPHCGKPVTPEASKEVEEIINALEDALVDMKSGKDIARSKANVERYQRKATMYYGNNPKIAQLVAEINVELKKAEKSSRNNAILNWINSHKLLTAIVAVVVVLVTVRVGSSIVNAVHQTHKNNPQICLEKIKEAIAEGDLAQAEVLYGEYAIAGKRDEACVKVLVDAFFNAKDYVKVEEYAGLSMHTKIRLALIADGQYTEAEDYMTIHGEAELVAHANECIVHMLETGVDPVKITAYCKGIAKKAASFGTYSMGKEMRIEKQLLETAGLDKPKQESNRKSLADAIDEAIGDDFGF